jgi:hypothetical protein
MGQDLNRYGRLSLGGKGGGKGNAAEGDAAPGEQRPETIQSALDPGMHRADARPGLSPHLRQGATGKVMQHHRLPLEGGQVIQAGFEVGDEIRHDRISSVWRRWRRLVLGLAPAAPISQGATNDVVRHLHQPGRKNRAGGGLHPLAGQDQEDRLGGVIGICRTQRKATAIEEPLAVTGDDPLESPLIPLCPALGQRRIAHLDRRFWIHL